MDTNYKNIREKQKNMQIKSIYENSKILLVSDELKPFIVQTEEVGEGEWEALTLEDAKQMAFDFADGVS